MRLHILTNPRFWSILLLCFWLTLFVLTHLPKLGALTPVTFYDKAVHGVAYALLAVVLATTWQLNAGELWVAQLGWAWFALVLYAALDEWTQPFVGREASFGDWIADVVGAAVGVGLFVVVRRWSGPCR
jgi:VanZ family protein